MRGLVEPLAFWATALGAVYIFFGINGLGVGLAVFAVMQVLL